MNELMYETIWFDQRRYEEAESLGNTPKSVKSSPHHHHHGHGQAKQDPHASAKGSSIVNQIAKARETIQQTLKGEKTKTAQLPTSDPNVDKRLDVLEKENEALKEAIKNINLNLSKLEARINEIDIPKEKTGESSTTTSSDNKEQNVKPISQHDDDDDDDDDVDLFGSDEEDDAEAEKLKQKRIAEYEARKSKKPTVIAKSNIILDVKPWDDETDMAILEQKVRSVACDGLLWGSSKLVAVGYGIKKLQITCVVEDDKCGTDFLEEEIAKFEDHVQSIDVVAFNKV